MRLEIALWLIGLSLGKVAVADETTAQHSQPETREPAYLRLHRGDPEAVTETEESFRAAGEQDRGLIALQLVRSGNDHDGVYFQYLFERAQQAIDQDTPFPFELDDDSLRAGKYSLAFQNWCSEHGKTPDVEARRATVEYPPDVARLGRTRDPRAFDLLLRGLTNPNLWTAAAAARGLGRIGDTRAIEPLLKAVKTSPPVARKSFVAGLVYFDEPRVRKVVAEILGGEEAFDTWRGAIVRE